jgi:hypothetical protein
MSTSPRLVHLRCSTCQAQHWEIDCDYRGMLPPTQEIPYAERCYRCPVCERTGSGYVVLEQSAPAFFLQPHSMYPMSGDDFDHWVTVVRENFPDHPKLRDLGVRWYVGAGPVGRSTLWGSYFLHTVRKRLKFCDDGFPRPGQSVRLLRIRDALIVSDAAAHSRAKPNSHPERRCRTRLATDEKS